MGSHRRLGWLVPAGRRVSGGFLVQAARRRFCSASEKNLLYTDGVRAGGNARREQNPTTFFQDGVGGFGEKCFTVTIIVKVIGDGDCLFRGGCVAKSTRSNQPRGMIRSDLNMPLLNIISLTMDAQCMLHVRCNVASIPLLKLSFPG